MLLWLRKNLISGVSIIILKNIWYTGIISLPWSPLAFSSALTNVYYGLNIVSTVFFIFLFSALSFSLSLTRWSWSSGPSPISKLFSNNLSFDLVNLSLSISKLWKQFSLSLSRIRFLNIFFLIIFNSSSYLFKIFFDLFALYYSSIYCYSFNSNLNIRYNIIVR